jgi:hypothetical protein
MIAFFAGLLIGAIGGIILICIFVAERINQADYTVEQASHRLTKMEKMLRECIDEANYLSEIGIFVSTRATGKRITIMREKIEKVLADCECVVL